jgi:hypothetical protein
VQKLLLFVFLLASIMDSTPVGGAVQINNPEEEEASKPVLRLEPSDKSLHVPPTSKKKKAHKSVLKHSQREVHKPVLRHSKGVEHIGLHAGLSSIGYKAMGNWGTHVGTLTKASLLLGLEWKEQETALYRGLFTGPIVGYVLLSTNHLYFNVLVGLLLTYTQYEEQKLKKKQSNFNVGALLGPEVELFLLYPLALTLSGGPMLYILEDPYQRLDYWLSVGLSINF